MTGLVLKLGPHERIMINGVVIENGDRRARLNVLTPEANVLRLRDAIHPDEANTPVRRVCYIAQLVLAGEADAEQGRRQLLRGIEQLSQVFQDPDSRAHLDTATAALGESRFYQAMRALRCSPAPRGAPARIPGGLVSYVPAIPLAGVAGWRFLERTAGRQQAAFETSPDVRREIAYFEEKIGSITRAADLIADRRLLKVALDRLRPRGRDRQEGLRPQGARRGHHRPRRPLPCRLADPAWRMLSAAFGFGDGAGARTGEPGFAPRIIAAYKTRAFEAAVGDSRQRPPPRHELPPRDRRARHRGRSRRELVQGSRLEAAARGLRDRLRPAQGFREPRHRPPARHPRDADRRRSSAPTRSRSSATPAVVEKMIARFLARAQIAATGAPGHASAGALALLRGSRGGASGLLNLLASKS